jgi:hypothetical protein
MHSGYMGIAIDLAAAPIQLQLILTVGIALTSHAASLPGPIFNPSGGGRCRQLYLGLRRTIGLRCHLRDQIWGPAEALGVLIARVMLVPPWDSPASGGVPGTSTSLSSSLLSCLVLWAQPWQKRGNTRCATYPIAQPVFRV